MPDSKITALTSIGASTDPANDPLVLVDVSDTSMAASGTTKKVTLNQLLGAGGTATLASATITGDLTVDTSTLKVDSTNNYVGIGTASPSTYLDVYNASSARIAISGPSTATSYLIFRNTTTGTNKGYIGYEFANDAIPFALNGSEAMRLNSTGLGVGAASPSQKLHLYSNNTPAAIRFQSASPYAYPGDFTVGAGGFGTPSFYIYDNTNSAFRFVLDSSGNVGVGVTPSAWNTLSPVQVKNAAFSGYLNNAYVTSNAYYDATFKYIAGSSRAALYNQSGGVHSWYYDSGTQIAGQNTTFTQAMTLTASGDLLVGTTGLNATWNTRLTLSSDSGTTRWAVGPYSTSTNFVISGASGGGVYLNGTAATSWTSASDERLKDIIEPICNAVAKVGSLRAVIGKFKNDSLNTRKSFLIAQDVQSVLPEAVDASNPDQLGVAYTDVIPLLVAAIKELTARVQTLEAK